jgi:hypothetical protein
VSAALPRVAVDNALVGRTTLRTTPIHKAVGVARQHAADTTRARRCASEQLRASRRPRLASRLRPRAFAAPVLARSTFTTRASPTVHCKRMPSHHLTSATRELSPTVHGPVAPSECVFSGACSHGKRPLLAMATTVETRRSAGTRESLIAPSFLTIQTRNRKTRLKRSTLKMSESRNYGLYSVFRL